jgi:phosphomevalonate decarboxylase
MVSKATAIAHPIQGLIKYHGLRDEKNRLPFHDSISVCADALFTKTTVEFDETLKQDSLQINGKEADPHELERAIAVVDALRSLAGSKTKVRIISENSTSGKGLGYSSSAFAALGKATAAALGLNIDEKSLSEIVRLGSGSATRSLTGSFSIWYANKRGRSYSQQLISQDAIDFKMVIIPIVSKIKTEQAHREVLSSPFFKQRLKYIKTALKEMKKAIKERNTEKICELAEIDTLNLHAVTMTGANRMLVFEPQSISIIRKVLELRASGIECWYSLDTGPSVFINSRSKYTQQIVNALKEIGITNPIVSGVGGKAEIV